VTLGLDEGDRFPVTLCTLPGVDGRANCRLAGFQTCPAYGVPVLASAPGSARHEHLRQGTLFTTRKSWDER